MSKTEITMFCAVLLLAICSSAAQSDCDPGLSFDTISRNNIAISWNASCYKDATTYTVELLKEGEVDPCPYTKICGENTPCETDVTEMSCSVSPCLNVTMKVSGGGEEYSRNITTAPQFRPADWKIESSDITENTLNAKWGPPDNSASDFVSCATEATVAVTCLGDDGSNKELSNTASGLNVTIQNEIQLDIYNCNTTNVKFTVIYMSGDELTETKKDHNLDYDRVTTVAPTTTAPTTPTTTTDVTTVAPTTTAPTTHTTTTDETKTTSGGSLSGGEIARIVIGCLTGVAIIGGSIF